jgi:hypothetical protein
MPQTEARTRSPKIATVERREASVPALWGRKAPRKRLACGVIARPTDA